MHGDQPQRAAYEEILNDEPIVKKGAFVCEMCWNESNFAFQHHLIFFIAETETSKRMDVCSECLSRLSALDIEAWRITQVFKAELDW